MFCGSHTDAVVTTKPQAKRHWWTLTLQHTNHTVLVEGTRVRSARLVLVVWWRVAPDELNYDHHRVDAVPS